MLMGDSPACQRRRPPKSRSRAAHALCYSPISPAPGPASENGLALKRLRTRTSRMEFGLLPKFSTPVEKPVENEALAAVRTLKGLVSRHFFEAKVHQARFEAILRGSYKIQRALTGVAEAKVGKS